MILITLAVLIISIIYRMKIVYPIYRGEGRSWNSFLDLRKLGSRFSNMPAHKDVYNRIVRLYNGGKAEHVGKTALLIINDRLCWSLRTDKIRRPKDYTVHYRIIGFRLYRMETVLPINAIRKLYKEVDI
jgi:hypothetical protein